MISPAASKFIGYLPKGLVRFLSKKILYGYIDKYANIKVSGMENIQDIKEPKLFICNHLSNSDALILNKVFKEQDLTFVAGVKLSGNSLTNLGMEITKTVNIKPNTADKEAISNIVSCLKGGNNMLIFPEGTRSRTATLNEARKGIVLIQKLSKAKVIPVGLWGSEKLLPINEKDMALEDFHYADVYLNIGKPVEVAPKNRDEDRKDYEERATTAYMKSIAALLPEEYRGVYK
ncbi:MAG: lysophospholipid acyltransferase family protein [Solirubrobacterales bacterium]